MRQVSRKKTPSPVSGRGRFAAQNTDRKIFKKTLAIRFGLAYNHSRRNVIPLRRHRMRQAARRYQRRPPQASTSLLKRTYSARQPLRVAPRPYYTLFPPLITSAGNGLWTCARLPYDSRGAEFGRLGAAFRVSGANPARRGDALPRPRVPASEKRKISVRARPRGVCRRTRRKGKRGRRSL